jgi:uncharacterized protein (DUF924 family)
MDARAEQLLDLWFGPTDDPYAAPPDRSKRWFARSDDFDAALRAEFLDDHARAARGELDAWAATARGRLALIVLLDQLSRNMLRGTPGAFATDPKALALCVEGIECGHDRELRPVERYFHYMPLMHAESIEAQDLCVASFERLVAGAPDDRRALFTSALDYAVRHRDIVARFGRFPHRNAILGRPSTLEEVELLKQPGSSF